jgi:hypothetical protein
MMQVNLNLAPARAAVILEAIDQGSVVLFGWIEVGVAERLAIIIGPRSHGCRVLATPFFQTPLLFIAVGQCPGRLRSNCRLEVIGYSDDQVDRAQIWLPSKTALPDVRKYPGKCKSNFFQRSQSNHFLGRTAQICSGLANVKTGITERIRSRLPH